jgi:RNA polymerase-binding transcription factor DksA
MPRQILSAPRHCHSISLITPKISNKSYEICEVTGELGTLRTDIGWYRTLCDVEYEKIKNKK